MLKLALALTKQFNMLFIINDVPYNDRMSNITTYSYLDSIRFGLAWLDSLSSIVLWSFQARERTYKLKVAKFTGPVSDRQSSIALLVMKELQAASNEG